MTLKEYNAACDKIIQQYFTEEEQIIEKARLDGTWIEDCEDANRYLFAESNARMHEQLMQLQNKYRMSGFAFCTA